MSAVFISSSIRELEAETEAVKEALDFIEPGEITSSEDFQTRDSLLTAVVSSRIFILILWQQYSEEVVEEYERASGKNVPILVFIKKLKDEWNEKRDPRLEKWISTGFAQSSRQEFRDLSEFKKRVREAVGVEIGHYFKKTPFLTHSHKDLYELGTEIAGMAKERVTLFARSLILITGPRANEWEKLHFDCLEDLFHKAKKGNIKFSCGYTVSHTLKELRSRPELRKYAYERLEELHAGSTENISGSKFRLVSPKTGSDPDYYFMFIVADDRFAIWFKDPETPEIYPCISWKDHQMATSLTNIFDKLCVEKPLSALLRELKLNETSTTKEPSKPHRNIVNKMVSKLEGIK